MLPPYSKSSSSAYVSTGHTSSNYAEAGLVLNFATITDLLDIITISQAIKMAKELKNKGTRVSHVS